MRIVALIPLLDTHSIPSIILKNIVSQTIEIEILPITRPISEESKKIGWSMVALDRDLLRQWALKKYPDDDKFLSLNRRVLFSSSTDVEDMIKFLDEHNDFGAIALNTKEITQFVKLEPEYHVNVACMVIKRTAFEKIKFHNELGCECAGITRDIRSLGMKIDYLDDRQLSEISK